MDFFTAPPDVEVLDVGTINATGSLAQIATKDIQRHNCVAEDEKGDLLDGILRADAHGVLYVRYCSLETKPT